MKISSLPHAHILVVDDNHDGLVVRKSLLEEAGFSVQVASSGEEGLKLFEGANFQVVVTDYRMPRMDGAEVIRRIRALNPAVPIILLSGFVDPLGLTEQSTGADAVLAKNANEAAHLVRLVKRLLIRGPWRKPVASQKREVSRVQAANG